MQAFLVSLCLLCKGDPARIPRVLKPCSEPTMTNGVRRKLGFSSYLVPGRSQASVTEGVGPS